MAENIEKKNENGTAARPAASPVSRTILDPEEQIKKFGKGKITLRTPIQDGQNTVEVLHWDFTSVTGAEYVAAMDRGSGNGNTFRITNTQALELFAVAAAKATGGIDATDIRTRIGMVDALKVTQVATIFFTASNRAGNRSISDE